MKNLALIGLILIGLTACSTSKSITDGDVRLSGKLEKIGMSTFQYGTHTLQVADKSYALRTSLVDFAKYEGQEVKITGKKVAGYPLEGGPELIDVTKISN